MTAEASQNKDNEIAQTQWFDRNAAASITKYCSYGWIGLGPKWFSIKAGVRNGQWQDHLCQAGE